ncbi:MAG TPA: GrpB family protein [Polyangia bacterium]|nr:GrpB family protein [Polyangia bacterium]
MSQDEPVEITDHDPHYEGRFRAERDRLRIGLATASLKFEHIGSTAVPGLAGRPIVDLMLGAPPASWAALDELRARVVALGYEDLGDGGIPGRVCFRRRTKLRAFDLVLVEEGGAQWRANVGVREYLRAHAEEAAAYGEAKRTAAAGGAKTLLAYRESKRSALVALVEKASLKVAG